MKSVKDEGLITQLAVVATMMPKVKEYIDQQADRIAKLEKDLHMIQRHYDQLETSLSGNNGKRLSETNESLPRGKE